MKEIYIRNKRIWVKISRKADKSFVFAIGYSGECQAFHRFSYPREFMPTIAQAREQAKNTAGDYI